MKLRSVIMIVAATALVACSNEGGNRMVVPDYPMEVDDERRMKRGRIGGREYDDRYNLLALGGGTHSRNAGFFGGKSGGSTLWRATLDTLSFMPFDEVDTASGVLVTDWYENPDNKGERFKINALVNEDVKLNVFKQEKSGSSWNDVGVDAAIAAQLVSTIKSAAGN